MFDDQRLTPIHDKVLAGALSLTGPGLSYPWRFDNAPLVAAIERCVAATGPDRALVWPGAEGAWMASGVSVLTTMPLWTGVEQEGARLRRPSTSTKHTRQEAM